MSRDTKSIFTRLSANDRHTHTALAKKPELLRLCKNIAGKMSDCNLNLRINPNARHPFVEASHGNARTSARIRPARCAIPPVVASQVKTQQRNASPMRKSRGVLFRARY